MIDFDYITDLLDTLADDDLSPAQTDALTQLEAFVEDLENLIEGLLKFTLQQRRSRNRISRRCEHWKDLLLKHGLFPHGNKAHASSSPSTASRRMNTLQECLETHDETMANDLNLIRKHLQAVLKMHDDINDFIQNINNKQFVKKHNAALRQLQNDSSRSESIAFALLRKNVSTRTNLELRKSVKCACPSFKQTLRAKLGGKAMTMLCHCIGPHGTTCNLY